MSFLLLAMIVYLADAALQKYKDKTLRPASCPQPATLAIGSTPAMRPPEWTMCWLTLVIPIAALMANRWLFPYACSEDFRYIYPAIISFCGLLGLSIQHHLENSRPNRAMLGIGLCLAMTAYSLTFFMVQ
jgi:hypothetical protein